jgi:hypothetical protein
MRWLLTLALLGALLVLPSSARADPTTTWTPGPDAVGDNTYDGYIDTPAMNATVAPGLFPVRGWFVDKTAHGWSGADQIQLWLGAMNSGTLLAIAVAGTPRPDVAAALGNPYWATSSFVALVPADALALGPQTLSIYAHTPGKGWWYKQVTVNVSEDVAPAPVAPLPVSVSSRPIVGIEKPKDGELVLTNRDYEIVGYALDKNAQPGQGVASSGVDRVQVYIGGERDNGGVFVGDATLGYTDPVPSSLYGSQFTSAGWRLTFSPTRFHVNTYLMYAYARSVISGNEDSAVRFFAIRDTP